MERRGRGSSSSPFSQCILCRIPRLYRKLFIGSSLPIPAPVKRRACQHGQLRRQLDLSPVVLHHWQTQPGLVRGHFLVGVSVRTESGTNDTCGLVGAGYLRDGPTGRSTKGGDAESDDVDAFMYSAFPSQTGMSPPSFWTSARFAIWSMETPFGIKTRQ